MLFVISRLENIDGNGFKENITLIKKRMEDVDTLDVPKLILLFVNGWAISFI
jgi:hypothetical protein